MADITWSAYALAMFTPEQRAAAVNAVYEPPEVLQPLPPPTPPTTYTGYPLRITGPGIPVTGYDPNVPSDAAKLYELGWRFVQGEWRQPGSLGVAATTDEVFRQSGDSGRAGLSSVTSASAIQGSSVLGTTVPVAPAVLLPSFVGGLLGVVRLGGGMRPESGGTPRRVVMGPGGAVLPQVRMGPLNWGR